MCELLQSFKYFLSKQHQLWPWYLLKLYIPTPVTGCQQIYRFLAFYSVTGCQQKYPKYLSNKCFLCDWLSAENFVEEIKIKIKQAGAGVVPSSGYARSRSLDKV